MHKPTKTAPREEAATVDSTLWAAVIATAGTIGSAGISTYGARQARHARKTGEHNAEQLREVKQRQASSMDERRIRRAVIEVERAYPGMIDQAVATEAVRDLLDALIGANLSPDEREQIRRDRANQAE